MSLKEARLPRLIDKLEAQKKKVSKVASKVARKRRVKGRRKVKRNKK